MKIRLRRLSALTLAGLAVLSFTTITSADYSDEIEKLEDRRYAISQELDELEYELARCKADAEENEEYLRLYDEKMKAQEEEISNLRTQIQYLGQRIDETEKKIDEKQREIDSDIEDFKMRLRSMYMQGGDSLATLLVGSTDFYDLLVRTELMERISRHDKKMIDDLTYKLNELSTQKEALESDKADLEERKAESETVLVQLRDTYQGHKETKAFLEAKAEAARDRTYEMELEQESVEADLAVYIRLQQEENERRAREEEERRQREEAERREREREEEERRQREEEERRQQESYYEEDDDDYDYEDYDSYDIPEIDTSEFDDDTDFDDDFDEPDYTEPESSYDSTDENYMYSKADLAEMIKMKEDDLKELKLNLKQAKLEYEQAKKKKADGKVVAELDGVVKKIGSVDDAAAARSDETPDEEFGEEYFGDETDYSDDDAFAVIEGEGGVSVTFGISELKLDQVHIGDTINVMSYDSGFTSLATISEIEKKPASYTAQNWNDNPNASTFNVRASLDDASGFSMYDWLSITLDSTASAENSDSVYLPIHYVRKENGNYYIMRAGKDGRLEKRYIKTGKIMYGYEIEVTAGISMKDKICFPYGKDVKEGVKTKDSDTVLYPKEVY